MIIYHKGKGRKHTAWIEDETGKIIWSAGGVSEADAIFNLLYALTQRDDPTLEPHVEIVEK
jgi:hypothetical protein